MKLEAIIVCLLMGACTCEVYPYQQAPSESHGEGPQRAISEPPATHPPEEEEGHSEDEKEGEHEHHED